MKALYKMNFDCGRQGSLEGVFIADTKDVEYLVNNKVCVYFGEVLGKHSDIRGTVDKNEIKRITTNKNAIKVVEDYGLENGYNPFKYNISAYDMEDLPENGIEWSDCTVQEYLDFKRKGIVPEYYKKEYEEWLKNNKEE